MGKPATFTDRLAAAVDAHDLEAVVDCFTEDYQNETPAHPARGFRGREQVRANWSRIFTGVPDVRATVVRGVDHEDTVWSEWELRGTRRDGEAHLMRGVIIFGLVGPRASWARFYLEQVDTGDEGVDEAVTRAVGR